MKLLQQNAVDDNLLKFKEITETIEEMDEQLIEYDIALIRYIVEKIIVKSSTEIEIHLFGGLIITEHLPSQRGFKEFLKYNYWIIFTKAIDFKIILL